MIALDAAGATKRRDGFTVLTFGDSILDCARYNEYGVHPGQLILCNDDHLFPDFGGNDLLSFAFAQLNHRARDGSRVEDLLASTKTQGRRAGCRIGDDRRQ
jgi:hypothetical protein